MMNEYSPTKNIEKSRYLFLKNEKSLFPLYVIIIIILIYKTGVVSDGFCFIYSESKFSSFFEIFLFFFNN